MKANIQTPVAVESPNDFIILQSHSLKHAPLVAFVRKEVFGVHVGVIKYCEHIGHTVGRDFKTGSDKTSLLDFVTHELLDSGHLTDIFVNKVRELVDHLVDLKN